MLLGLPEEVLAATKANFEPYLAHAGREQTGRVCHLRRAAGNGNARQKLAPEAGLARLGRVRAGDRNCAAHRRPPSWRRPAVRRPVPAKVDRAARALRPSRP